MKWLVLEPDERGFRDVVRSGSDGERRLGRIEEVAEIVIAYALDGKSSDFESVKEAVRWLDEQASQVSGHAGQFEVEEETREFYARRSDPSTSHESAHLIKAEVSRLEGEVLTVVRSASEDGTISDEIVEALPEHRRHTIVPRLAKLQRKGLIEVIGKRLSKSTGRYQQLYRAVPVEMVEEAKAQGVEEERKKAYKHVAMLLSRPFYREAMQLAVSKEASDG